MKAAMFVIFSTLIYFDSYCQLLSNITLYQKIPNLKLGRVLNNKVGYTDIKDLRGKKVILDFWSRTCSSCIATFPEIERLNEKYKDDLLIIPVTQDNYKQFLDLKKKSRIVNDAKLPFVIEDSLLHLAFPHRAVPLYIWLNEKGEYLGNTIHISEYRIQSFLKNGVIRPERKTMSLIFPSTYNQSIEGLNYRKLENKIYYSLLNRVENNNLNKEGYSIVKDSVSRKGIGYKLYAVYLIDLIDKANGSIGKENIVVGSDELRIIYPPKRENELIEWEHRNLYNYELIVDPDMSSADRKKYFPLFLQHDLKISLGIIGKVRKMVRPCFVLKEFPFQSDQVVYKMMDTLNHAEDRIISDSYTLERHKKGVVAQNVKIDRLIKMLTEILNLTRNENIPVVNITGYSNKIDMNIEINDFNSIDSINKGLRKYGLMLEETNRLLTTLVLEKLK